MTRYRLVEDPDGNLNIYDNWLTLTRERIAEEPDYGRRGSGWVSSAQLARAVYDAIEDMRPLQPGDWVTIGGSKCQVLAVRTSGANPVVAQEWNNGHWRGTWRGAAADYTRCDPPDDYPGDDQ